LCFFVPFVGIIIIDAFWFGLHFSSSNNRNTACLQSSGMRPPGNIVVYDMYIGHLGLLSRA
jgi:hypothetical protein